MENSIYKSEKKLLFIELIKKTIVCFVCFMLLFLLLGIDESTKTIVGGTFTIVCCFFVSIVFAAVWAFYWSNITIELTKDKINFYRGSNLYYSNDITTDIGATIQKNHLYGIYTGTLRTLYLPINENKNKVIPCRAISKQNFSRMIEEINAKKEELEG